MSDALQQLSAHFGGLWVRQETPYGQVFVGRDATGVEVTIAVLNATSAGDPAVRNGFADAVWRHSVGSQGGRASVYAADLQAPLPWAAIRAEPGQAGAERLLEDLGTTAPTSPIGYPGVPPAPASPPAGFPGGPPAGVPGGPAGYPSGPPGAVPPGSVPPGVPPGFAPVTAGAPGSAGRPVWPWLLAAGAGALVLVMLVVGGVVALRVLGGGDDPVPGPVDVATAGPTEPTEPAPTGPADPDDDPDGEPALRPVDAVSVVGPTFGRNDETYTMQFRDFPFAFRVPLEPVWNCIGGEWEEVPEALVWVCVGGEDNQQRAHVVLWECETTCTPEEQRDMVNAWLDEPERAVQSDTVPLVRYVETGSNDRGYYQVDLAHFFGDGADPGEEPLRWMVGVYVESPPEVKGEVQKILNDIVTQTS